MADKNTGDKRGPGRRGHSVLRVAEFAVLPGTVAVALVAAVAAMREPGWAAYLLPTVTLGLGVLTGARLKLRGALVATLVVLAVLVVAAAAGFGYFWVAPPGEALAFGTGFAAVFFGASGAVALVAGYQARTAELAEERASLLERITHALPVGIWLRARGGETVFLNQRWADFAGRSPEAIMASGSAEPPVPLGPEWEAECREILESDDGTVRYRDFELEAPGGGRCQMTLLTMGVYLDPRRDRGILALLVDETAVRLFEKRVRRGERRLRLALESAGMGVWERHRADGEHYHDPAWFRIFGGDPGVDEPEALWRARLHPDDRARVESAYGRVEDAREEALCLDYRLRRDADGPAWVRERVRVIRRDADGAAEALVGAVQEITDLKRIETDLKQARDRAEGANEAKSQFIATISHEIRTPLNAIIGLSSFLSESQLSEEQQDLAQTIYSSGRNLLLLVNDILDFSKIESGRFELEAQEFPVRLCFEECVKLFGLRASELGVDLRLELADDVPEYALGDMERLRQIVQNLLSNALKFTDSGEVVVSVKPCVIGELPEDRRPDPLEPKGYLDQADHEHLLVTVRDTGIGIPKDRQHALFHAFSQADASTTRKYGGTGLGLAICKQLAEAMGGTIWLESEEGRGAVFGFVVRTKFVEGETGGEGLTRTPFVQMERIAEAHPCDILVVGDGEEAQTLLRHCRGLGYSPHHSPDYKFGEDSRRMRHYNIVFVWMGDESAALALTRRVCAAHRSVRPDAIVGVAPEDSGISPERCRLTGMRRLLNGVPDGALMREVILDELFASG